MASLASVWFVVTYLAAQVYYHGPREQGTFWWMALFAATTAIGLVALLGQRIARNRRDKLLSAMLGPFEKQALGVNLRGISAPSVAEAPPGT
jgi:hypothetical protein